LLSQRDKINLTLQEIIDRQTDPWGIKVTAVEVKDVVLPDSMKRAMAGQAESERERRAKIINAEGEFQAAEKLVQAASMIAAQPIALQLRFLQTMKEISSEHNTTTILPVPIELFAPILRKAANPQQANAPEEPAE
jgi:regulator of protease activity HflC (stomatin/prohibitin superfamily)